MKGRKPIILAVVVMVLVLSVSAQDVTEYYTDVFDVKAVQEGLDRQTRSLMGDITPATQADISNNIFSIFQYALARSGTTIKDTFVSMIRLILIVVLCQVADAVVEGKGKQVVTLAGALAIVACCVADVRAVIEAGRSTVSEIADFTNVLLPVMVSAATASGALSGATAVYTLTTAFSGALIHFIDDLLIPSVYAYLALALADASSGQTRMKKLRELICWGIEKLLRSTVYIFTGILSVTGLLTKAADSATLKVTKSAISGVIPVVGGILSSTADAVLSGAVLLKNAVGTYGMLAVFAIFIVPFLFIGSCYIMLKATAALCGVFSCIHSDLLEAISVAMGHILAMTASCALMALISCCFFIKVVHI